MSSSTHRRAIGPARRLLDVLVAALLLLLVSPLLAIIALRSW